MLHEILNKLRKHWIYLVATFLLFQLVSYILLTPTAAVVMRLFIALFGHTVIANEEITRFLLHPIGIAGVVVMGTVAVTIFAIQQATLLIVMDLDGLQHYPVAFVLE